jgi:hypothetical protein
VKTSAGHPSSLTEDFDRRVVMIMGPSGLHRLLGLSGFQMLHQVGHSDAYIARQLQAGSHFSLVVFPRPCERMRIATWTNAVALIAQQYPEVEVPVRAALRELRSRPIAHFERQAGFSFSEVDANGASDARFMTVPRLLASDLSPVSVRRFLFHTTRLNELYTGDGYTRTSSGMRGVREYILANHELSDMEHIVVQLRIELPGAARA